MFRVPATRETLSNQAAQGTRSRLTGEFYGPAAKKPSSGDPKGLSATLLGVWRGMSRAWARRQPRASSMTVAETVVRHAPALGQENSPNEPGLRTIPGVM